MAVCAAVKLYFIIQRGVSDYIIDINRVDKTIEIPVSISQYEREEK